MKNSNFILVIFCFIFMFNFYVSFSFDSFHCDCGTLLLFDYFFFAVHHCLCFVRMKGKLRGSIVANSVAAAAAAHVQSLRITYEITIL